VTFRGRDIFSVPVPRSGAKYNEIFEWAEAAHWKHIPWEEFDELDGDTQAFHVAHYRAHHQLEAVIAKHQFDEMKRRSKQPKGPR
jgi:hypothetical protein